MENMPTGQLPAQVSQEEIEIINDIRKIDFGRIMVNVQNGVIVSREITITFKNGKHKNNKFNCNCNMAGHAEEAIGVLLMGFSFFM